MLRAGRHVKLGLNDFRKRLNCKVMSWYFWFPNKTSGQSSLCTLPFTSTQFTSYHPSFFKWFIFRCGIRQPAVAYKLKSILILCQIYIMSVLLFVVFSFDFRGPYNKYSQFTVSCLSFFFIFLHFNQFSFAKTFGNTKFRNCPAENVSRQEIAVWCYTPWEFKKITRMTNSKKKKKQKNSCSFVIFSYFYCLIKPMIQVAALALSHRQKKTKLHRLESRFRLKKKLKNNAKLFSPSVAP